MVLPVAGDVVSYSRDSFAIVCMGLGLAGVAMELGRQGHVVAAALVGFAAGMYASVAVDQMGGKPKE